ncbi:hypothetical protein CRUP_017185 [Coryphaenoides rupestris]|nr:hypothetical protein CRUP_017185 [Coryphaenoides rupestris]
MVWSSTSNMRSLAQQQPTWRKAQSQSDRTHGNSPWNATRGGAVGGSTCFLPEAEDPRRQLGSSQMQQAHGHQKIHHSAHLSCRKTTTTTSTTTTSTTTKTSTTNKDLHHHHHHKDLHHHQGPPPPRTSTTTTKDLHHHHHHQGPPPPRTTTLLSNSSSSRQARLEAPAEGRAAGFCEAEGRRLEVLLTAFPFPLPDSSNRSLWDPVYLVESVSLSTAEAFATF